MWLAGIFGVAASLLPILQRLGPSAIGRLKEIARRVAPFLRRVPRRWNDEIEVPADANFDTETRRIGPSSWQRFGHPQLRFRSERELREYLGPAGSDREWHHIVEKRLAENGKFPPEFIHSTDNIINLPVEVHRRISAKMSEKSAKYGGLTRRQWTEKFSFGEQYNLGIDLINETAKELDYDIDPR